MARIVRLGDFECVAVPIHKGHDLLLLREPRSAYVDPRVLQVLIAFWLLALLTAWSVVRGLVRPLRHLARQLPRIETPGPLELPEAARQDEIGDLARSFLRTREVLQDERETRQRMEKLAVLGRMTAALAHEIQNPVAAIRMHAQLSRAERHEETATIIEHEAARIESLLNQWLFLTRPEPPAMRDGRRDALGADRREPRWSVCARRRTRRARCRTRARGDRGRQAPRSGLQQLDHERGAGDAQRWHADDRGARRPRLHHRAFRRHRTRLLRGRAHSLQRVLLQRERGWHGHRAQRRERNHEGARRSDVRREFGAAEAPKSRSSFLAHGADASTPEIDPLPTIHETGKPSP